MDPLRHRVLRGLQRWRESVAVVLAATVCLGTAIATEALAAPGAGSVCRRGAHQGLATSATPASKPGCTLGQGLAHEVYFPQADTPNVQDFQCSIIDGRVRLVESSALIHRRINVAKSGKHRIAKTYLTHPDRATRLFDRRFEALSGGQLYFRYNPSLNGSGPGDTAASRRDGPGDPSADGCRDNRFGSAATPGNMARTGPIDGGYDISSSCLSRWSSHSG